MSKIVPAAQAKTNFGALLDAAQREPVTISKKGRSVAVLMSMQEYQALEDMKLERLRLEIRKGLDQLDKGQGADGKEFMQTLIGVARDGNDWGDAD